MMGRCVGWFEEKGYGFLRPEGGQRGADIFVNRRVLLGGLLSLEQGQRLEYEIGACLKTGRREARNVKAI